MLGVEDRFVIQDLYRTGVSISEIARQTGHDRKTVRRVLTQPLLPSPRPRKPRRRKIDPWVPYLERRIADGVLNAHKLYQEIQVQGYPGKETQVRTFVQPFRQARRAQATVRFETEPGEQAQVDWAHFGSIQHEGRQRRLYAFVMTLGWSRALYLEFTVSRELAWFLRGHQHAFHAFGGVPRQVLHDNLKTAVLSRESDGTIHWQPQYLDFARYYGFTPRACQPYRAQTKGKVESAIKYVRGNFWLGLRFTDLTDLNRQAQDWLATVANVRVHGTTGAVPAERLAHEGLVALAGRPDYDTSLVSYRRSSRDCLISYQGNAYSVPAAVVQQQLLVRESAQAELVISTVTGEEVARHQLAQGVGQRIILPAHAQSLSRAPSTAPPHGGARQILPTPHTGALPDAPIVEVRALGEYDQLAGVRP
jgi:transposase